MFPLNLTLHAKKLDKVERSKTMTNTLAYHDTELITAMQCLLHRLPVSLYVMKHFLFATDVLDTKS
jgi:hypothetical protein